MIDGERIRNNGLHLYACRLLDRVFEEKDAWIYLETGEENRFRYEFLTFLINYSKAVWGILFSVTLISALIFYMEIENSGLFFIPSFIVFVLGMLYIVWNKRRPHLRIDIADRFSLNIVFVLGTCYLLDVTRYKFIFNFRNREYYFRYIEKDYSLEEKYLSKMRLFPEVTSEFRYFYLE